MTTDFENVPRSAGGLTVGPLRSYESYVAGEDRPGVGWVYTMSARGQLDDPLTSLGLKSELEQGRPYDPARHGSVIGRCAISDQAGIEASVTAAAVAAPAWAAAQPDRRMLLGELFRREVERHHDSLVDLLAAEGTPRTVARWELTSLLQAFSKESCGWYAEQMHAERVWHGRRLIVRRLPDGVVCVDPPQNAPAGCAAIAVLALMAGNAVVVRAPRSIPLSTMCLFRDRVAPLLAELNAPAGVLNVVCGRPRPVLDTWLRDPRVDDIVFFGDSVQGMRLQGECVAQNKKPILELAGNDGLVVWRDADLDWAAEAITECFYASGQICMVPNYVIAHPDIADELITRVSTLAAALRPGYPDEEGVLLAPVRRIETFFALLAAALDGGAELRCGGRRIDVSGVPSERGVFLEPTVLRVNGLSDACDLAVVREETFFPLIPIVVPEPGSDGELLDRSITFVNDNKYGLRNSLWARSDAVIHEFVLRVHNGGLLKVNDSHIGFLPYLPTHGGTGLTSGAFGEANYTMLKTSHLQGVSVSAGVSPRRAAVEC